MFLAKRKPPIKVGHCTILVEMKIVGIIFGVGFPTAGIWPIANSDTEIAPEPESNEKSYNVTNEGASAYIFNGEGLNNVSNPDLTLKRGETYIFNADVPGHPFYIKTEQSLGTGDTYDNGVTNNGASSGTVTFTVPNDAPSTLYYICEFHSFNDGNVDNRGLKT